MKLRSLAALLPALLVTAAPALAEAPFYRVFRGFKLASIPADGFPADFSEKFVPETARVMAKHSLISYVPALAPRDKPDILPDEVAIVVYGSGEAYAAGRADPERKAYGALHWDYFETPWEGRTKSHTAVPLARALESEVPVDVLGTWPDWQTGTTFVFMGTRTPEMPRERFLAELTEHVVEARETLVPLGLDGYVLVANEESEIAWMHWPDSETAAAAFATPAATRLVKKAADLLDTVMWSEARVFEGSLDYGEAVTARFRPSFRRTGASD